MRVVVAVMMIALTLVASSVSEAHRYYHRGYWGPYYGPRVGIYVGSPWYWGTSGYWTAPYYWGSPWYWGVPAAYGYPYWPGYATWGYGSPAIGAEPPSYVERAAPAASTAQGSAWYYCTDPPGYYPHVSLCSRRWIEVPPFTVQR